MKKLRIGKKGFGLMMSVVILAGLSTGCGGGKAKEVTIASKQFTENILLSEMYAQLIESHTDIKVTRKQNLGGTSVCFPAMQNKEVDIYVEYSGTAYNEILNEQSSGEQDSGYIYATARDGLARDYNITMFEPIGINNTFALGMQKSKASELGISSMSDLSAHSPDLSFGANHIFYTRELDGFDAMSAKYDYNFSAAEKMDTSLLYEAIDQGLLDVIVIYATDSLLIKYDMIILKDDMGLFPAYHGAPICRDDVLEANPELSEVLNKLAGMIDDTTMQELDYQIDVENKLPEDVARQFLTEKALLAS